MMANENISKIEALPEEKSQSVDLLENAILEKQKPNFFDQKLIADPQETDVQKNIVSDTKKLDSQIYIVQFGVFAQKNGAEKLKKKIDTEINKKYEYFESDLIFNDEKKKYYLVFETKEKKSANNICIYSKDLKVDCYVRKK
tara:strand:+ start:333 stop:758 length:426 start_codon:yes stop_codon:yes gene_type:complete